MNDFMTKLKAKFSKKNTAKAQKVKNHTKNVLVPSPESWRVVTIAILLMALLRLLESVCGWLNGSTLVSQYGMDPVLVDAIVACPDLLFYATYVTLGLSIIFLVVVGWMFVYYICDEVEGSTALNVTLGCSIAAAWSFPVIHVITDLTATGFNLRDTGNLDAFKLGVDMWPLVVITVVCVVLLIVNKRVSKLLR